MREKVIKMYDCSYYINEISEELEITLDDVLNVLEKNINGFQYNGAKRFSQSHLKRILIEYVDKRINSKIISKKYGHCAKTVLKILHENRISLRPAGTKKIFIDDEPAIIKKYLDGTPTRIIASHYNVRSGTILQVLHKNNIVVEEYKPTLESRQAFRKHNCNTSYFEKLDSADKVYFLGLFAADGFFRKNSKTGVLTGISISLKESSHNILELFLKHIDSTDELRDGSYKYTYKGVTKLLLWKKAIVHSKIMAEDVRKQLELPLIFHKTFDIKYPTTIPPEYERHFCRGLLCGDGNINPQSKKVTFYGTEKILEGVRKAICRNCSVSYMKIKPKVTKTSTSENTLYQLAWSGKRQVLTILDWLYEDTNLFIKEKYNTYRSIDRQKGILDITEVISIEELISLRKDLGLSQLAVSRAISCSNNVISELERKIRTSMNTPLAKRLLDLYQVKYDQNLLFY